MRLFGSDRIVKYMEKMGLEEGQELEHPLLNRSIEQAQKRVEQHNFQIRKRTLEYDDVMNKQREVIYGFRNEIIHADDVRDRLMDIMEEVVIQKVEQFTDGGLRRERMEGARAGRLGEPEFPARACRRRKSSRPPSPARKQPVPGSVFDGLSPAQFAVCNFISDSVRKAYELKISFENPEALKEVERYTILSAIDRLWQEHLYEMDSLRYSIGLRGYGQRDPLIEYKAEAYKIFDELMVNIKTEICHNIFRSASSLMAFENFLRNVPQQTMHQSTSAFGGSATGTDARQRRRASRPRPATSSAKPRPPWKRPSPSAPVPRWAATIPAPAAAARNTSSAAENSEDDPAGGNEISAWVRRREWAGGGFVDCRQAIWRLWKHVIRLLKAVTGAGVTRSNPIAVHLARAPGCPQAEA